MSDLIGAYLDTSFIVAELLPERDRREHVAQVARALFDRSSLLLISDLKTIKLAQAFKVVANDPTPLSEVERRRHRLHRWGDVLDVRPHWYELCFTRHAAVALGVSARTCIAVDRELSRVTETLGLDAVLMR